MLAIVVHVDLSIPTLDAFLEEWPRRFPRHPRTIATNAERIRGYILPYLPRGGEIRLDELRRADLKLVQDALLRRRLAKSTIDGALCALSALLRDAVDIELIEANVAARMRVRPADPRLNPTRGPVQRRAVPPDEIRAFMASVDPRYRAACGRLMNGLKGTHHIANESKRGRWTLFPSSLIDLLRLRRSTDPLYLFTTPRGKFWSIRNFYRDVWEPAQAESGVSFTLYDLRHTFSSRLLAAGIPPLEVSAWMGHSLRVGGHAIVNTTTRVYAHATGEWREAALQELRALMLEPPTPERVRMT
jgi:integrase